MKYIDEYRDGEVAQTLAAAIRAEADPARSYHFMEFCGGHTHAISRYGVSDLLPANVKMIHGPGCPVCVLPIGRVDQAIRLALEQGVTLCTYGDCLRVPASNGLSLMKAKARGGDIRMVYSSADAVALAQKNPDKQVVFFAIGFETTTPPTALVLKQAAAEIAVICGTDARYGTEVTEVVEAARAAGVQQIYLAGPEKAVVDVPAAGRPDGYLTAKIDAVEALSALLTRLGA